TCAPAPPAIPNAAWPFRRCRSTPFPRAGNKSRFERAPARAFKWWMVRRHGLRQRCRMTEPNALLLEATAAYNQGNWQRAFDLAIPLLAIAPEHAGVHHVVGLAALGLKQMPLAIRHLQRALKLEPRSDYAAHFAKVLSLVNQVAVARVVVDKALTLP